MIKFTSISIHIAPNLGRGGGGHLRFCQFLILKAPLKFIENFQEFHVIYDYINIDLEEAKFSQNEGKDGFSTWIILELLPVVPVLAQGPHHHLVCTGHCKKTHRKALGHQSEAQPGSNLICIVWAGDQVEKLCERVGGRDWDLPDLAARGPEVPEQYVDGKVAKLAGQKGSQAGQDLDVAGGCVEGMVDMVGNIASKAPVVATVLKEVGDGHGGV